jgi:hypothetical protein
MAVIALNVKDPHRQRLMIGGILNKPEAAMGEGVGVPGKGERIIYKEL